MSEQVWKFPLQATDHPSAVMPKGARILTAAFQSGVPTVWARISLGEAEREERRFRMAGTGHDLDLPAEAQFIGTMFHPLGLVFHLWEV